MLDPRERMLLFEALRPPLGHSFDRAIGTTFSLDPTALLAVPLAFAAFDVETEDRAPHEDSLALLEAVRRNARHVSLFCQAGRIGVPARYRSLMTYLERSVIEVTPPREGYVFHPKTWLVRYHGPDDEIVYRFLCLSRNLTFDRSWDTVLALEGALTARRQAFAVNHPLADYVAALPGLAVRDVPSQAAHDIELMQDEVRRVRFEPPEGFKGFSFLPLGLSRRKVWPFPEACTRGLVVSPFLSAGCLARLPAGRGGVTLVSRLESLDELRPDELAALRECYSLSEAAEPEPDDSRAAAAADRPPENGGLSGLHAKLFAFDQHGETSLWTGSANATSNAFEGNVEFLVELRGPRWFCGAERTLGDDEAGLKTLLEPYTPAETSPGDPAQRRLDYLLDRCRTVVASQPLQLRIEPSGSTGSWQVALERAEPGAASLPLPVHVSAWPITVPGRATACGLDGEVVADFGALSLEALTPFVAFTLHAQLASGQEAGAEFVVNVPLVGEPAGRSSLVLREMLRNPGDLVALLLLLLADDQLALMDALTGAHEASSAGSWHGFTTPGLFEALVGALARDPQRLRAVKRLVEELRAADGEARSAASTLQDVDLYAGEAALIPEGFEQLWEPVWAAARALGVRDVEEGTDA